MLRKALPGDTSELKDLAQEVIRRNYTHFLGTAAVEGFIGSGASDAEIDDGLENCIVMTEGDGIIGFVITRADLLHLIMISVAHQRQGYGAKLLDYAESIMLRTFDVIHLQTFAGNTAAICFYQKQGWAIVGEKDASDMVRFVKKK